MWRMIAEHTQWGPFAQTLEKMAAKARRIRGRKCSVRTTTASNEATTCTKSWRHFIRNEPVKLMSKDVQVVAQYPTQLGQSRDPFESFFGDSPFGSMFDDDFFKRRAGSPFGRSLTVTGLTTDRRNSQGRADRSHADPDGWPARRLSRCAVGQYQMVTQATPVKVKAGDPITSENRHSRHRAHGIGSSPTVG